MKKIILNVKGMSCNHCKMAIENELKNIEGVSNAVVNLEENSVEIEYNENKAQLEQFKKAIEEAGYSIY